jgi:hypothetical protein
MTVTKDRCDERHKTNRYLFGVLFATFGTCVLMAAWAVKASSNAARGTSEVKSQVSRCEEGQTDLRDTMLSQHATLRGYHGDRRRELADAKEEIITQLRDHRELLDQLLQEVGREGGE